MSRGQHSITTGRAARLFAALIGVLLSLQVALAYAPLSGPVPPGHIRTVICGPEALQTVTIDLSDGSVEVDTEGFGASRCPFCILGLADLTVPFVAPLWPVRLTRSAAPVPFDLLAAGTPLDPARPIRAPPARPLTV